MPLLAIWRSDPQTVAQFSIEQVVSVAGGGDLRDNSACSDELRAYLREAPTDRLAGYLDHCLSHAFPKSGFVLQDIVNELGRRLDYEVENGRYQGTVNAIGFDGLWQAPEGNSLIVEVKTTDAYRISLDKLAGYRSQLRAKELVAAESSILIVTGRDDTGELEAQIRGSRHAWDVRLISAEALLNLVRIKESTEGRDTTRKIRRLLIPMEFTRLDGLIEVIFATTKDVETAAQAEISAAEAEPPSEEEGEGSGKGFTDPATLNAKREAIVASLERRLGANLIRHGRALYWDSTHQRHVAVTISKRYLRKGQSHWYAYHPQWDDFLAGGKEAYLVLGCVDKAIAFAVPLPILRIQLPSLNTTSKPDGTHYWHITLREDNASELALRLPKAGELLPLSSYEVVL